MHNNLTDINSVIQDRSPLEKAFIAALGLPNDANVSQLEMGKTPHWDSVAHIQLVAAIEDALAVVLDGDDILAITSYAATRQLLKSKYAIEG